MNYSKKNTISQQKNDGQSYSLGITQSSGLDRLSGYPDNCSVGENRIFTKAALLGQIVQQKTPDCIKEITHRFLPPARMPRQKKT